MEKKTYYLTKGKLEELRKEFEDLVRSEKERTVSEEAPKILESDDLNPEFASFQEDMGFLRGRIDELRGILENYELIKGPGKDKQGVVAIGASVKLDANGDKNEFTIVGTLEADPASGKISNESPVGKALLGRQVGEEVEIPAVNKRYKIKSIKYELS